MTNTKPTLNKPASTETTEKYTEAQTKELLQTWENFCSNNPHWQDSEREKADTFISELAAKYQKSVRSIIGKLTRHNVYVAKAKAEKKGAQSQNKAELAQAIGKVLRLSEPEVNSLVVAGKTALSKIFTALANSKPIEVLTPQQLQQHKDAVDLLLNEITLESDSVQDLQNVSVNTLEDITQAIEDLRKDLESNVDNALTSENQFN